MCVCVYIYMIERCGNVLLKILLVRANVFEARWSAQRSTLSRPLSLAISLSIGTERLAKRIRDFPRGLPLSPLIHTILYFFRRAQVAAAERARAANERQLQLHATGHQRVPVRRPYAATKTGRIYNCPLRRRYLSLFITCHYLRRLFRSLY